jgi:predicted RNA-binding Zn-ribbon protein involved in translation (DUF1610 family)
VSDVKVLYIDIETSPNIADVWGLFKQNVGLAQLRESQRIIGVGYRWRGGGKARWVGEYDRESGKLSNRLGMLRMIHRLYDEADVVVSYNGDSFDHKHLNAEWVSEGLTPPSPYQSLDLFKVVRKNFRFPSKKLAYVAERLVGDTKVANGGHVLWRQCLDADVDADVRRRAWALMSRYCRQDVDLLEPLHDVLEPWLSGSINFSLMRGPSEELGCPKCGGNDLRRRGFAYTSTRAYQRYQCRGCGGWTKGAKMAWGVAVS